MMNHIYDYDRFSLLEAFDLNKMYQQQNIISEFQTEAKKIVDKFFNSVNEIPQDMQKNRDKVEFWLAKNMKKHIIEHVISFINTLYDNMKRYNDKIVVRQEEIETEKSFLNYIKGKSDYMDNEKMEHYMYTFDYTHKNMYNGIFDYFLSPMRNIHEPIDLITTTIGDMRRIERQWHREIKASGKILHEKGKVIKSFPDGYYWIDLLTNSDRGEANAMGHCGTTSSDTILSLRKRSDGGHIEPFVTIAIDYQEDDKETYDIIHQIKGKGNKKPIAKYYPYIVELLLDKKLDIQSVDSDEYSPEEDFHLSDLDDRAAIDEFRRKKPYMFNGVMDIIKFYREGILHEEDANIAMAKNALEVDIKFIDQRIYYVMPSGLSDMLCLFTFKDDCRSRFMDALNALKGDNLKYAEEYFMRDINHVLKHYKCRVVKINNRFVFDVTDDLDAVIFGYYDNLRNFDYKMSDSEYIYFYDVDMYNYIKAEKRNNENN
jgi:hypothetical protein